jgi:hypothetical protein
MGRIQPVSTTPKKIDIKIRRCAMVSVYGGMSHERKTKIYNEERPHAALGKLSPIQYRQQAEFSPRGLST